MAVRGFGASESLALLGYGEMVITLDFDSGISGSSPDSPAKL